MGVAAKCWMCGIRCQQTRCEGMCIQCANAAGIRHKRRPHDHDDYTGVEEPCTVSVPRQPIREVVAEGIVYDVMWDGSIR